jgi:hypothetical protein
VNQEYDGDEAVLSEPAGCHSGLDLVDDKRREVTASVVLGRIVVVSCDASASNQIGDVPGNHPLFQRATGAWTQIDSVAFLGQNARAAGTVIK